MISFTITKKGDTITEIKVNGHALFADFGSDIVCSAVSTAIIMTINAFETCKKESSLDYQLSEGQARLTLKKQNQVSLGLLENLAYVLRDLKADYPKNIREV